MELHASHDTEYITHCFGCIRLENSLSVGFSQMTSCRLQSNYSSMYTLQLSIIQTETSTFNTILLPIHNISYSNTYHIIDINNNWFPRHTASQMLDRARQYHSSCTKVIMCSPLKPNITIKIHYLSAKVTAVQLWSNKIYLITHN